MQQEYQIRAENGIAYNHRSNNFQHLKLVDSIYGISDEVAKNEFDNWLKDNKWKFRGKTLRLFEINSGKLVKTYMC